MILNKTFGSALIVAGTTIGAGMLAMPLTSADMGFGFTFLLLICLWGLLCYSALLFVEAYQKSTTPDAGIASLAEQYFNTVHPVVGKIARIITTLSLWVFMYAITTVYILGAASVIEPYLGWFGEFTHSVAIILFTIVFGAIIVVGAKSVDLVTRLLFALKLVAFGFVVIALIPNVTFDNLTTLPTSSLLFFSASPVIFTAFGFHAVIPSLNKYLEGDIKKLRIAIIAGTAIPLVIYTLWQLAVLGGFDQNQFTEIIKSDPTVNGLVTAAFKTTGNSAIGTVVSIFSVLALLTSFLGVTLALFDFVADFLKRIKLDGVLAKIKLRTPLITLATFAPPLLFALFYNDFLKTLSYAGQIFAFYGLLLPIAIVFIFRKNHPDAPYKVLGGKAMLIAALVAGLIIIAVPYLINADLLPSVVGS